MFVGAASFFLSSFFVLVSFVVCVVFPARVSVDAPSGGQRWALGWPSLAHSQLLHWHYRLIADVGAMAAATCPGNLSLLPWNR